MAGPERGEPPPRADLAGPARVVKIRRWGVADLLFNRPGGTPGGCASDRPPERAFWKDVGAGPAAGFPRHRAARRSPADSGSLSRGPPTGVTRKSIFQIGRASCRGTG